MKNYLILFFLLSGLGVCHAQQRDSLKVYDDIRQFAYKRKVTRWLYLMVFVDKKDTTTALVVAEKPKNTKKKPVDPNRKYKGKIIRSINITSLDPFGKSVQDTSEKTLNLLRKTANKYHVSTRKKILNNQILIKENEPLDLLKLKESERLLRTLPYLKDAAILVEYANKKKDSVDIKVITQDRWTVNAFTTFQPFRTNAGVSETNFLGIGHGIRAGMNYNVTSFRYSMNGNYSIANIGNSYISLSSSTVINPELKVYTLNLDRPIFSSFAKWGGGFNFSRNAINYYQKTDSTFFFKINTFDQWGGRAFNMTKNTDRKLMYKFILAGRVNHTFTEGQNRFHESVALPPAFTTQYLGTIAVAAQKYYKDINIFRFGIAEDIPEGHTVAIVAGYEKKPTTFYNYAGFKFSYATHIDKLGYVAAEIEPGTFFRKKTLNRSVINFYTMYFTETFRLKNWMIRQFADYSMVLGDHRDPGEILYLRGTYGIPGYKELEVNGHSKMVITFKTMCYVPYRVLGFGFAFFSFASFGTVGSSVESLYTARVNQGYGMGINIRNELLVFNTVSVSFGIYPRSPGKDIGLNGVSTGENRFKSYYYAKPFVAPYQ